MQGAIQLFLYDSLGSQKQTTSSGYLSPNSTGVLSGGTWPFVDGDYLSFYLRISTETDNQTMYITSVIPTFSW